MNGTEHKAARRLALAASTLLATSGLIALEITYAAPAAAVAGLSVVKASSASDSLATKSAEAFCPEGKRVVSGGGGLVWTINQNSHNVVVTQQQPIHPWIGRDSWVVTATETPLGESLDWSVQAVAVCANALPGLSIEFDYTTESSGSVRLLEPECDDDKVVLGTGGWIVQPTGGQVALQVLRASTLETFAYVQAREDADGYLGQWSLWSFIVCADRPSGYEIRHGHSPEDDSETNKTASVICSGNKKILGAGGAVSFAAPGNVSLLRTLPDPYLTQKQVDVVAVEHTPTSTDWDFIVSQIICAN